MLILLAIAAALAAEPSPPALVDQIPPTYPASELASGRSSAVLLELDVRADGTVADARIAESGGEAFDAAAIQAALSFRFTPATDERGQAVPVTILYRTVFEPDLAPPVVLQGRVRAAGTREVLSGYRLLLERGERTVVALTDGEGSFELAGLEPGTWTLSVAEAGWRLDPVTVTVVEGQRVDVDVRPVLSAPWEAREDGVSEEIVVEGRAAAPEVTERLLSQEEARYLPGTNGDIVRVVQNLPGVARPPLNIGQLIIRGTAPEDSAYYLDGARIPSVFHFAGFSTVLAGDSIAEIAFLPGNYGVRYGRTLGGVVDLRVDDALPERNRGYVSVDLFQSAAFVEQRWDDVSLQVSGRRSYADVFLNPVLAGVSDSTIRVPRYFDLQAHMTSRTAHGRFDALLLASDDRFSVVGQDADEVEQTTIGLSDTFQKLRLRSVEQLGGGPWRNEASLIAGPERRNFEFDGGVAYEEPFTVGLREELLRSPSGRWGLGWRLGVDAELGRYRYDYAIPLYGAPERADTFRLAPAAYLEPTIDLGAVQVVPGVRVDGLLLGTGYGATAIDPRLATRLELGATALKASAGGYSQFGTVRQLVEQPDLGPARSWQVSAGVEQRIGPDLSAELVGYHAWLDDLVSGREDAFRFFSGPPPIGPLDTDPYANDGTGRVAGLEALVRYADERTAAWVSATFSRSTRVDRPGEERALFEYDQPVVLTALASRELPRRWRIGIRARYGSGNPYTPVVNRTYDLDQQAYRPVYGELDGARLPAFWSLDTRVDKDWVFRSWTLTAYVDVQNTTNNANVEVMSWNTDYSEEDPVTSIPAVPVFGLRGEW
ncbi:MAG: TonB family protein [Alphaproteobacteria bacterium]|nr:TonB family protein [Alphaproteobacteria bacterium]